MMPMQHVPRPPRQVSTAHALLALLKGLLLVIVFLVVLPSALIGAALYIGFLAFQAFRSADLLMTGLIFKVPVVILLLVAVVSALRRPTPPPPLPAGDLRA